MDPIFPNTQRQCYHPQLRDILFLLVFTGDPTGKFPPRRSPLRARHFQPQPSPLGECTLANCLPNPAHRMKTGIHPLLRESFLVSFYGVLDRVAAGRPGVRIAPLVREGRHRGMTRRALPRAVFTERIHELLDELDGRDSDCKEVAREIWGLVLWQAGLRDIAEDLAELLLVREEVRGMERGGGGLCDISAGSGGDDVEVGGYRYANGNGVGL